jgi:hypothetical protein
MRMLENTPERLFGNPLYAHDKAVRDAAWESARALARASTPSEVNQLVDEGYFERARSGDAKGASLYARLLAHRLNPNGIGASFGALRKGGGQNVDGYAEDAIVSNNVPSDLFNVFDTVSGAGAPGASPSWNGPLPRRSSDTWEAPRALNASELAYLGKASEPQVPTVPNVPTVPVPQPAACPNADSIARIQAGVIAILQEMAIFNRNNQVLHEQLGVANERLDRLTAGGEAAKEARDMIKNGLAIDGDVDLRTPIGRVNGKITGKVSG